MSFMSCWKGGRVVREWNKIKVGEFLFEQAGKYKPNAEEIVGLTFFGSSLRLDALPLIL